MKASVLQPCGRPDVSSVSGKASSSLFAHSALDDNKRGTAKYAALLPAAYSPLYNT